MAGPHKRWTEQEDRAFTRAWINFTTIALMASNFGVSYHQIRQHAVKLGLDPRTPSRKAKNNE